MELPWWPQVCAAVSRADGDGAQARAAPAPRAAARHYARHYCYINTRRAHPASAVDLGNLNSQHEGNETDTERFLGLQKLLQS